MCVCVYIIKWNSTHGVRLNNIFSKFFNFTQINFSSVKIHLFVFEISTIFTYSDYHGNRCKTTYLFMSHYIFIRMFIWKIFRIFFCFSIIYVVQKQSKHAQYCVIIFENLVIFFLFLNKNKKTLVTVDTLIEYTIVILRYTIVNTNLTLLGIMFITRVMCLYDIRKL